MTRILLLAIAAAVPALAQSHGAAERTTAMGVFTESQVLGGELVYKGTCSVCHVPADLIGEQFRLNWLTRTVWEYFDNLRKTMPEDNVGGLSNGEYTQVTAYILRMNGYPAGADSLPADSASLSRIRIGPLPGDTAKPRRLRR